MASKITLPENISVSEKDHIAAYGLRWHSKNIIVLLSSYRKRKPYAFSALYVIYVKYLAWKFYIPDNESKLLFELQWLLFPRYGLY